MATGSDVIDICDTDQLACGGSGLKAGIEGVIQGLLLVDARNAFNVVNRVTAFWKIEIPQNTTQRIVCAVYGALRDADMYNMSYTCALSIPANANIICSLELK